MTSRDKEPSPADKHGSTTGGKGAAPDKKYAPGRHPNSLANLKQWKWKKGQSGNPAGRPKGRTLTDYLRIMGEQIVEGPPAEGTDRNEVVAAALWRVLMKQLKPGARRKVNWELFRQLFGRIDPLPTRREQADEEEDVPQIIRLPFKGGPERKDPE